MAKNLLDMEWKNRDCDAIGVRFYPTAKATHGGFAVTAMQIELYLQGYLSEDSDVDGCVGSGTLKALAAYRRDNADRDTATSEGMLDREPLHDGTETTQSSDRKQMLEGVPHISQWIYDELVIAPERQEQKRDENGELMFDNDGKPIMVTIPAKTCQDIGCLSCCSELMRAFHLEHEVKIEDFVGIMHDEGGYDKYGNIQWDAVQKITALDYRRNIGFEAGQREVERGNPVILCVPGKTPGKDHFVVGIGFDDAAQEFYAHDVGSWRGNAYENPGRTERPGQTVFPYSDIRRVDVLALYRGMNKEDIPDEQPM